MILRNIAIRHGRKALAAPLQRSTIRSLTTEVERFNSSIENHVEGTASKESKLNQLKAKGSSVSSTTSLSTSSAASDYNTLKHVEKSTGSLGSVMGPFYEPHKLVTQPPAPKDVTLEILMASQAHMGHSTSHWNPGNQRYIHGIRQGIHIISLEATAAHLRRAAKVVEGVAYHGGLVLFVGTRPGQDRAVVKAAELSKGCHLFQRWIPGSLTNGDQILGNGRIKAVDEFDQRIEGDLYTKKLREHRALKPDLVVCLNPLENYICLHECGLHNIPTIGIIDTNADPTWVTYPIPANDDSIRAVQLIAGVLGRAGEAGQKRRLQAAKAGTVTFETKPMYKEWVASDAELSAALLEISKTQKAEEEENKEMRRRMNLAKRGRADPEERGEEDNFEVV